MQTRAEDFRAVNLLSGTVILDIHTHMYVFMYNQYTYLYI